MLEQDLQRAVAVAARHEYAAMLPWLIRAAHGPSNLRRNILLPEPILKLATEGKLDRAEARLRLFSELGEDWQTAARLIIAWLGAGRSRDAARQLLAQTPLAADPQGVLDLLADRLGGLLGQACAFVPKCGPARLELAREIVNRMTGEAYDREALITMNPRLMCFAPLDPQAETTIPSGYIASLEAPILVDTAREYAEEGTTLVDRYIESHAQNRYVEYRNRSLWCVLEAVLRRHPDPEWVKQRLRRVLVTALSTGTVDFHEMLPLTASLLRERATTGDARPLLDHWKALARAAADTLRHERYANDTWGTHKRRLTTLMEIWQLVFQERARADALLGQIRHLPGGFAGFQAPAGLRLADALRACGKDAPGLIENTVEAALRVAHQVQDYHLCARVTARCNAMMVWHRRALTGEILAQTMRRLAASPGAAEFATAHRIHEPFGYRAANDPYILPIAAARDAATLEQLVEVFQRPAVEFRRLNPQYGLTERLPDQTPVLVPDPGFAPLLALHLGARALADDALVGERTALLRALVPVAAPDPTALDTLLSYLLIAMAPDDPQLLERVVRETGELVFPDLARGTGYGNMLVGDHHGGTG